MKKFACFSFMLVLGLLMAQVGFGWDVPGSSFGLGKDGAKLGIAMPAAGGEDAFILMPTTNIGFDLANSANFGLGVSYSFMFAHVEAVNPTTAKVSPFFGVGPFISANVGKWISSQGNAPLSANIGFIFIGPMIQDFPELGLELGWQTDTGAKILEINASFPLIIAPDSTIHKL